MEYGGNKLKGVNYSLELDKSEMDTDSIDWIGPQIKDFIKKFEGSSDAEI